jgi:predicted esterase
MRPDIDSVIEFTFTKLPINPGKVFAYGFSLGAAMATLGVWTFPKKSPFKGLILENPFRAVPDVSDTLMPMFAAKPFWLSKNLWPTEEWIPDIIVPIMFIAGADNKLVPPTHSQLLRTLATKSGMVDYFEVQGAGHSDILEVAPRDYMNRVSKFMADCVSFAAMKARQEAQNSSN